jgi:tight adherence protein B
MRGRRKGRRNILIWLLASFAASVVVPSAAAANVRIKDVDTSGYPVIRMTVVAPKGSQQPRVREDDKRVVGQVTANLGQTKTIIAALDRSQSMRGKPIANALAAARQFVGTLGSADHVGIVAFGRSAIVLQGAAGGSPGDAERTLASISVDTRAGTALYDAIVAASNQLRQDDRPGRAIVVVTDGADVGSLHSLRDAVDDAKSVRASVYTIGIGGPDFTPDALRQIASETGGTYRQAARAAELAPIYASLKDELARTWQVSYDTALRPGDKLRLNATVPGAGSAAATVALPASDGAAPAPEASPVIPSIGYSSMGTLLLSGIVAFLVLLSCAFWLSAKEGSWLERRLNPHIASTKTSTARDMRAGSAVARKRLADSIETAFANVRQFKVLQDTIERADVPWRAGELIAAGAGAGLVLGLLTAAATASPLFGLVGMAVGLALPVLIVSFKASKRVRKFDNQLPDVLITIAASLKAGHSFRQGIQSVVEEGAEPASKEFQRVMNETQLGKPMDDALGDMADRVGSENLTFVVTAVTIQRQIGGSLAGLFDMVAETVRQRQQFARKIRSLTAMGRMSAYVLVGLPFFMAALVSLMNPTYMAPLFHTGAGHGMVIAGLVMMTLGSVILKKIVSFRG